MALIKQVCCLTKLFTAMPLGELDVDEDVEDVDEFDELQYES